MTRFEGCPVDNETPDPCPKCGATVAGDDVVNGVCQAGATWDRAVEHCAIVALEQRCERGTPWDAACVAIAQAIRGDVCPVGKWNDYKAGFDEALMAADAICADVEIEMRRRAKETRRHGRFQTGGWFRPVNFYVLPKFERVAKDLEAVADTIRQIRQTLNTRKP